MNTIKELILQQKQITDRTFEFAAHRYEISKQDFLDLLKLIAEQKLSERKSFVDFIFDKDNQEVIDLLYEYAIIDNTRLNCAIGIILNGKFGCGKSILMSAFCALLNKINAGSQNIPIKEYHAIELCELIIENGTKNYARIPLLIQDIGKEPKIIKDYGNEKNPLRELLFLRAEYGTLTFGTTNYSADTFEKEYPDFKTTIQKEKGVVETITQKSGRIFEHVNFIYLPGENRRQNFSINQDKIGK